MKRTIILCLLFLCCFTGCKTVKKQITISCGKEFTCTNKYLEKYDELEWSSSDENIVSVLNGTIKAHEPGNAVITIRNQNKTIMKIKMAVKLVPISSIILSTNQCEITEGEEKALSYTLFPENASDYGLTWKSADESVATVNSAGTIKGIAPGQTTISVSTTEGIIAVCSVSVHKAKVNLWTLFGEYDDSGTYDTITISKDGSWMSIDTNPDDTEHFSGFTTSLWKTELFLEKLGFSGAVYESMGKTNALQGKQQSESECCVVTWSYHPDNGLEAQITVK